ncbi:Uncharacterized protein C22orf13 [Papilio machaon]|uniref:Uncharacterized protein C22orf13 n=1 Tax=Papilio machaon TaxID=76193 RepID=A0A0N1IP43_PAPMA|nr:Uncharacterized protein C22orf13 [Papilio machaon]
MSTKDKLPIKPKYIEHKLNHYQQRFNWDCGIACVMMLLPSEQRDYLRKHFTKICYDEGFLQSTWTIDLCYLLKRFGIEHCMYTIVKGVNSRRAINDGINYQACKRVESRIDNAEEAGIFIKEKELSVEDLLSHVECKGPAIVLVDSPLLICDLCKHNKMKAEFRFGIEHCMYTIVKGVNSRRAINDGINYQACKRVESRIYNAEEAGIFIKEKELSVEDLLSHVECKGPAIVLVDSPLLICDLCKHNKMKAEFRRAFGGRYKGHYVLVVGRSGSKVLFRDPALSTRLCATSLARLHAARQAPGTDFDVILINKDYSR